DLVQRILPGYASNAVRAEEFRFSGHVQDHCSAMLLTKGGDARATSKSRRHGVRELAPAFWAGSLLPAQSAPASRRAESGSKLPHSIIRPDRLYPVILQLCDFDVPLMTEGKVAVRGAKWD
ncbi:MAG: hypothetical protein ACLQVL_04185, partial [Terriglobia bacterium]